MADKKPRRIGTRRESDQSTGGLAEYDLSFLFLTKDGLTDLKVWGLYALLAFWLVAEPHKMGIVFPDGSAMTWLYSALGGLGMLVTLKWIGPGAWYIARQVSGLTVAEYPWYKCLIMPSFWMAAALSHILGIALFIPSLWVFTDAFGVMYNAMPAMKALFDLFESVGLSGGLWFD